MILLLISLAALAIGPLLFRVADRARTWLAALDGFVMVAISGLVLVHIIPHSLAEAGTVAVVLAAIGFLGPGLLERVLHRVARETHVITLVLALLGLGAHALVDGIALGSGEGHGSVLAVAVALHRLPVAITIWWLLRPSAGAVTACVTLVGIAVATLAGYFLADTLQIAVHSDWLWWFQAFVAGSLLHVVIHRPSPFRAPSKSVGALYAGIGALVAVGLVALLADTHIHTAQEPGAIGFSRAFLLLAVNMAPALLLAFAFAGLLHALLPKASMNWMRTGRPASEAGRGVAFGLSLPICPCGVIPLYQTLIVQGAPVAAAMAFLVATPALGLDAIFVSWPLLGAELTAARVICALIVALLAGWLVGRIGERHRTASAPRADAEPAAPPLTGLRHGLQFGFGEIVDHVGPWLLVGLVVASLVEPLMRGAWLTALPWGVDVVLFALLGMPTYACASGATPLAAVLIHKGVSPGAALAFLLTGPATNVTAFGMLSKMHNKRIATLFGVVVGGLSVGLGMVVNTFISGDGGVVLRNTDGLNPSTLQLGCLLALAVVFALSIVRQGPRAFIGQVISPHGDDGHDHDHHHHHHVHQGG